MLLPAGLLALLALLLLLVGVGMLLLLVVGRGAAARVAAAAALEARRAAIAKGGAAAPKPSLLVPETLRRWARGLLLLVERRPAPADARGSREVGSERPPMGSGPHRARLRGVGGMQTGSLRLQMAKMGALPRQGPPSARAVDRPAAGVTGRLTLFSTDPSSSCKDPRRMAAVCRPPMGALPARSRPGGCPKGKSRCSECRPPPHSSPLQLAAEVPQLPLLQLLSECRAGTPPTPCPTKH